MADKFNPHSGKSVTAHQHTDRHSTLKFLFEYGIEFDKKTELVEVTMMGDQPSFVTGDSSFTVFDGKAMQYLDKGDWIVVTDGSVSVWPPALFANFFVKEL